MPTKTTTAIGGNINDGATWVGGVAPDPSDDLVIAAGAVLVLNVDFRAGSVDMEAGTTFNSNSNQTLDIDGNFTIREGCLVNGLTIVSVSLGTGSLQIGPASGIDLTITNCTITCQTVAYLNANMNLSGSSFADFYITGGSGNIITGGAFSSLSDGATGVADVTFNGTTIAQSDTFNSGTYWTFIFVNCTVTNFGFDHTADVTVNGGTFNNGYNTGTTAVNLDFTGATLNNCSFASGSGISVTIPMTDCFLSSLVLSGSGGADPCTADVSGPNTYLTGVQVNGYGQLRVSANVPDSAWSSVTANTNAMFAGRLLVDHIGVAGAGYILWGSGQPDDTFYVRSDVSLDTPTFNGGTWYIYAHLTYGNEYLNQPTALKLMIKTARITNGAGAATISYDGPDLNDCPVITPGIVQGLVL